MTSLLGWCIYFDGLVNHLRNGIGVLLVSPQGDHILRSVCLTVLEGLDMRFKDVIIAYLYGYLNNDIYVKIS